MKKTIFGILAAVTLIGGASTIAEAKANFTIFFGVPYYDQQIGPDYRYNPDRGWYRDRNYYSGRNRTLSCNQARNILRDKGFRNVIARDCQGRTYAFSTRRNNNQRVIIYVNARTGATWRS